MRRETVADIGEVPTKEMAQKACAILPFAEKADYNFGWTSPQLQRKAFWQTEKPTTYKIHVSRSDHAYLTKDEIGMLRAVCAGVLASMQWDGKIPEKHNHN